jgi:hypothetical protein
MQAFTDSAGRTWQIALTIDTLKRVKSLLQIDLARPDEGDPPLHVRIFDDVCLLADVVFAAVKPQADAAGVSDEVFGQALGGDAITAAANAFMAEWADFFRLRRRTDMAAVIAKYQTLVEAGVKAAEAELAKTDAEAMVQEAVALAGEKARAKAKEDLAKLAEGTSTPGGLSTSSPESAASIPDPSPSAS